MDLQVDPQQGVVHFYSGKSGHREKPARKDLMLSIGNGLEVKQSTIPGAGNGLFSTRLIIINSIFTWYATQDDIEGNDITQGYLIKDGEKNSHLVQIGGRRKDSHWLTQRSGHVTLRGITVPKNGKGGGSFANDPMNKTLYNSVFVK